MDTITVNLGKNIKLSGKGFKYCTADTLNAQGITACLLYTSDAADERVDGEPERRLAGPDHRVGAARAGL